jgi:hypothetical protein
MRNLIPSLVTAWRHDGPVSKARNREGSAQPAAVSDSAARRIAERMQVLSAMPQR